MGQSHQLGNAFFQKEVQGSSSIFGQGAQIIQHLGGIGNAELIINRQPEGKKGDE